MTTANAPGRCEKSHPEGIGRERAKRAKLGEIKRSRMRSVRWGEGMQDQARSSRFDCNRAMSSDVRSG
eukprot:280600-Pleurochrysis_carterae.AAC.2